MPSVSATAQLHGLLSRAQALAARTGSVGLAASFAAAMARIEALVVVRVRVTRRVPDTASAMPIRSRRRLPAARLGAHRKSVARVAQECDAGHITVSAGPHAADPQPTTPDRRACAGRPAHGGRDAGALLPDPMGRYGRQLEGRPLARDGPRAAV